MGALLHRSGVGAWRKMRLLVLIAACWTFSSFVRKRDGVRSPVSRDSESLGRIGRRGLFLNFRILLSFRLNKLQSRILVGVSNFILGISMRLNGHWICFVCSGCLILASFGRLGLSWNWIPLRLFIYHCFCSSYGNSLGSGLGLLLSGESIRLLLIWSLDRFLPLTNLIESFCLGNEVNKSFRQLWVQMFDNVLLLSVGEGRQESVLHLPVSEVFIAWSYGGYFWWFFRARARSLLFHLVRSSALWVIGWLEMIIFLLTLIYA